jgi:hypothetical protein
MNHTHHIPGEAPGPLGGARCPYHSSSQRMLPNHAGFRLVTTEGSDWCILHKAKCDAELRKLYGCGVILDS